MRLLYKLLLVFVILSLLVISIGGVWTFFSFTAINEQETDNELSGQLNQITRFLRKGVPLDLINSEHDISVKVLQDTMGLHRAKVLRDTLAYHKPSKQQITHRKVTALRKINDQWYQIEIYNSLLEPDDTLSGTISSFKYIAIALISISLILAFLVSKKLLNPFHYSLVQMNNFNIQQGKPLVLPKTPTFEFNKLNEFIERMTRKAVADYQNLKEFSENIAHEIRTPLAHASGNLDLLLQKRSGNAKEIELIANAQEAITRVSKIQHALSTLSKIQNEEFINNQEVDLGQLIIQITQRYADILSLKEIELSLDLSDDTVLNNDPALLEIMLTNLLQNAIKHNLDKKGKIDIRLNEQSVYISNTGMPLAESGQDMFERFKKNRHSSDSLGLGLAIVKNICQRSGYNINYAFDLTIGRHKVTIQFYSSDLNQN